MMQFSYHPIESFPRLAWCAIMKQGCDDVELYHGQWVEAHPAFYIEGLWEGKFEEGDFDRSYRLMGFGGRIRDDKIIVCTPCHVHERLYMIRVGHELFISPSLVCVLKMSDSQLDIQYMSYAADLIDMLRSKKNHVGYLPAANGRHIDVYHFRNIELDKDLNACVCEKPMPPDFPDYQTYKRFLIDSLVGMDRNANDPGRKVCFSPVCALSSGYDSTACAALATEIQCKEAVTFRTARPEGQRIINDSGKVAGEKLGLCVTEFERLDVLNKEGMPEAEFVACGEFGQDFHFSIFEEKLTQKYMISGWFGDTVWDRLCRNPIRDIQHPFIGGTCLTEFRYRVGFHFIIVPYIGIMSLPSIYAISISDEMKPWMMNTIYDRPIARRLAEEKGVERGSFAHCKKASSILLNRQNNVLTQMSKASATSFEAFYQRHKHERSVLKTVWYHVMLVVSIVYTFFLMRLDGIRSRLNLKFPLPELIPTRYSQSPGRPSFLVFWGIEQIRDRYRVSGRQE